MQVDRPPASNPHPIAKIGHGKNQRLIYITTDKREAKRLKLPNRLNAEDIAKPHQVTRAYENSHHLQAITTQEAYFEWLPSCIDENFNIRCAVYGLSGCGKSTFVAQTIAKLQKQVRFNPKKVAVLIFSGKERDPCFDCVANLNYVEMKNPLTYETMRDYTTFHDCILVFDDWSALPDEERKAVQNFMKQVLQNGRSKNIHIFGIVHKIRAGHETMHLTNEAEWHIVFPQSGKAQVQDFLTTKYGIRGDLLTELIDTPSRYIILHDANPSYCITEDFIHTL